MKISYESKPVEIFAGTPWQAGMVKSLLKNAGIHAFLKDELIGTLTPWWAEPGGAGAVKVFVSELDYDQALAIAEEYQRNLKDE
ncbi:MAG: DUF2007-related protein [Mangrovibacterium sp.]